MAVLKEFTYEDFEGVRRKLARFADAGPSSMHLVLDFDRTLTHSRGGEEIFTWTFLEQHLSAELRAEANELYAKYRPLEIRGELTNALANEWWNGSLGVLQRSGLDFRELEKEFASKATIRPGTRELFAWAERLHIPTVILSAGILNIIEMWCRTYEITPDVALATRLDLGADGRMRSWDRSSVIHVLNKREQGHAELSRLRAERPFVVLLGDSIDDADMAEGEGDVLRVRIYHPRPDERDSGEARRAALGLFDLVIEGQSLEPLMRLLEHLYR